MLGNHLKKDSMRVPNRQIIQKLHHRGMSHDILQNIIFDQVKKDFLKLIPNGLVVSKIL